MGKLNAEFYSETSQTVLDCNYNMVSLNKPSSDSGFCLDMEQLTYIRVPSIHRSMNCFFNYYYYLNYETSNPNGGKLV